MKKVLLHFVPVLLIVMGSLNLFAQTRIITGTVKDSQGEAIIGASIIVKGTTIGTYSDGDGNFSLAVTPDAKVLLIRYLGMKSQEITLGSSNTLDVKMEEDVLGLDEVVVTAIGVSKEKKALGYSVQDVGGDALTQAGQSNALTALSGKVAGLSIIQSSGSPGSSVDIRLRGATSLTGDNSPLIVVDGVPLDNSQNFSGNPDDLSNNYLQSVNNSNRAVDINPDDIESVTVLKGPAATALYGISAANGALIITTKKGGKKVGGGVNVTYTTNLTFDKVNKLPALQSMYAKGSGGAIRSYESGSSGSWGAAADTLMWDPNQTTQFNKNGELIGKTGAPSDAIPFTPFDNAGTFFQTGQTWENNLALSGGNDNSAFRFSFSSLKQDGIVPLANFKRYTAKMSGSTKLSSKLSTSGSATFSNSGGRRVQQGSNLSGLMLDLLRTPISFDNTNGATDPSDPSAYLLSDGNQRNYRGGSYNPAYYDNPYWTINQCPFNDNVNRVYGYGQVDYLPASWLTLTYRLGTDNYSDYRKQFFAIHSAAFHGGQIFIQQFNYFHVNSDVLATVTKKFSDDLDGGLTIGQNMYSQRSKSLYTEGNDLIFSDFQNMSVASTVLTRESASRYRTSAGYAAGNLSFKNMLYLNLTARNEMSSTLPKEKNTFFYPSASLGFVFTEALGMSTNKILPYGKIRASWASVGKDAPPYSLESYYDQAAFSDGWTPGIPFPVDGVVGYSNSYILGNPQLKPEKVNSTEFGVELKFLNNRIGIDATYYASKSLDQILATPVPGSSGYQYMYQNTGELTNNGIELMLTTTPVKTKNFKWDLNFNWSTNKSMVVSLGDTSIKSLFLGGFEGSAIYAVVGEEYGSIYGGRWLRDGNGNVVIDDDPNSGNYGYPIVDNQVGVIGNVNPDWIGGLNTGFTWKDMISLSATVDIRKGGDIWNGTKGALTFFGRTPNTVSALETPSEATNWLRYDTAHVFEGVKGHVDADGNLVLGDGANDVSVPLDQAWFQGNGGGFGSQAEDFVEDGSYIKLRELSLTYTLNPKMLKGTPIAGLDISFIGRNLWLHTNYTGIDPETSLTGSGNSQGMDYFNMPNTKSYGFSLRLTL